MMRWRAALAPAAMRLLTVALALPPVPAFAEPTDLDASFGTGGIFRTGGWAYISDLALFPDGGMALLLRNFDRAADVVIRLDAAGHHDDSYIVASAVASQIDSIAVTPAGRLMTLRRASAPPFAEVTTTRHLDNGDLDPAFGTGGTALVSRFTFGRAGILGFCPNGSPSSTSTRTMGTTS